MKDNNLFQAISEQCIERCKSHGSVPLALDDMWRGRAVVFFAAIAEASLKFDLKNDPSILWDLSRLSTVCDGRDKLTQYLLNVPGFVFDEPVPLVAFSQHYWLMSKFNQVILRTIDDYCGR